MVLSFISVNMAGSEVLGCREKSLSISTNEALPDTGMRGAMNGENETRPDYAGCGSVPDSGCCRGVASLRRKDHGKQHLRNARNRNPLWLSANRTAGLDEQSLGGHRKLLPVLCDREGSIRRARPYKLFHPETLQQHGLHGDWIGN